jgi:hypothetical protein
MDRFRLRAFYVLHKEKIDYILDGWIREHRASGYNYSRHNSGVYERAIGLGLEIPPSLFSRNYPEALWASYWRLFLHLKEAELLDGPQ